MISISIANPYEQPLDFTQLKAAARTVLAGEQVKNAKITLAFLNDAHIHRLNKQFLGHDAPTDVLTFCYSKPRAPKLEGEIVVGYETAAANAADRGHAAELELILCVIHGCLHLCGYDDRTAAAAKRMRASERKYLKDLNMPDITTR